MYSSPLPRQKDGMNRRIHSTAIAAFFRFGLGLAGSADSSLRIRHTNGPAIPMKKLKTITKRLAIDGDLK